VFAGLDPRTGRKRYVSATAGTEREAHRVLHRLITEIESGQVPREKANLNDLIKEWLANAGPAGENTEAAYRGYARMHIEPSIGRLRVGKIRVEDIDRWHAELADYGLAPASVKKVHNIVRGALTQGVKWGWLPMNVAALARPPAVPRPVIATPAPADVAKMIKAVAEVDAQFAAYLRLAAVTGARPGEMCGLRWTDIDFEDQELHIQRRVIRVEGQAVVKDLTKTNKTRRIPLDKATLKVLEVHKATMEERAGTLESVLVPDAFVFTEALDGSVPWRPDSTSRQFREHRGSVGLDVTLYSIRHQAATAMIDAGVDAKTVSERLGNSVTTVLTTYTRARTAADRAAAELMGSLLD
jgi:integrase